MRDPFAVERETLRLQPIELDSLQTADELRDLLQEREVATEAREDVVAAGADALREFEVADVLQVLLDSLTTQADSLDDIGDRLSSLPDDSLVAPSTLPTEALVALRDTGAVEVEGTMPEIVQSDMVDRIPNWAKGNLARRLEAAETPQEQRLLNDQTQRAILGQVPTALFLILPLFALLLKLTYLFGAGRSPRHPARPTEAKGGRLRQAFNGLLVARWNIQRWRQRRRVAKRRTKLRKRRSGRLGRPIHAARRWVADHPILRPWRVRRLRMLRAALRANRSPFYAEHLVFALHVHAYAFIALVPLLFLGLPGSAETTGRAWISWILLYSIPLYYLVAQHRVYKQSWFKTIAKSMVLGFVYIIVLALGTVLAGGLALRLN